MLRGARGHQHRSRGEGSHRRHDGAGPESLLSYVGHFVSEAQIDSLARSSSSPRGMSRVYFVSAVGGHGDCHQDRQAVPSRQRGALPSQDHRPVAGIPWGHHGGALVSGHTSRAMTTALSPELSSYPPAYCYRCSFGMALPTCALACAHELEKAILQEGKDHIAAFMAEPIVATASGRWSRLPTISGSSGKSATGTASFSLPTRSSPGSAGRKNFGIDHWG